MALSEAYQKQVALVMRVLPFIAEEDCFALKGGTAINFFIRNMPRLSVDIDLTYLPVAPRPESLAAIDAALKRIENRIKEGIPGCHISEGKTEGTVTKISVRTEVVGEPVEQGAGEALGAEHACPLVEGQIAGHDGAGALVALGEHLEQELGAGLRQWHVAQLVDDQQLVGSKLALNSWMVRPNASIGWLIPPA